MIYVFFCLGLFFLPLHGSNKEESKASSGCVSVQLSGQFGNQLFEIATAYAYGLDHNLTLTIPDLIHKNIEGVPYNSKRVFLSKIDTYEMPGIYEKWTEPSFNYTKIPDLRSESIELAGFFQSDKYFKHRRSELLELFAPSDEIKDNVLSKYPFLDSDALVVGIQIRDYRVEKMYGKHHPTIGWAYYEKAMKMFPEDTIFFVSSNNLTFAKRCTEGCAKNIVYEECSDYIEAFYALTLCKSFIISNSTFGWWAAWLSSAPNKRVFVPSPWFTLPYNNIEMAVDLIPEGWSSIQVKKTGRSK